MAKIIKEGEPKPDKRKSPEWVGRKVSCQGCNCVFKLEENDPVLSVPFSTACDDLDHYTLSCPQCKRKLKFNVDYKGRKIIVGLLGLS